MKSGQSDSKVIIPTLSRTTTGKSASIYFFKDNNENTRPMCEICSKLIINTQNRFQWYPVVFIFNFEQISHIILAFPLLTLKKCILLHLRPILLSYSNQSTNWFLNHGNINFTWVKRYKEHFRTPYTKNTYYPSYSLIK